MDLNSPTVIFLLDLDLIYFGALNVISYSVAKISQINSNLRIALRTRPLEFGVADPRGEHDHSCVTIPKPNLVVVG